MTEKNPDGPTDQDECFVLTPTYGARSMGKPIPKYELPENGLLPQTVYQLISDELMLDGNSRLNLATFVTTWMEPEAMKLMSKTLIKT